MLQIPIPDESSIHVKWANEKFALSHFLEKYSTQRYPDHPEYAERYRNNKESWKEKYQEILEKDRKALGIPEGVIMNTDPHGDFYILAGLPEEMEETITANAQRFISGLKRKEELEANNLADMANPIPEDEKDAAEANNDSRRLQNMTFQVTEDCTLRCTYCYQINKKPNRMPWEVAKKMVDRLTNEKYLERRPNMWGYILEFIGGEPFMEVELIDKILDYFYDICITRDLRLAYHTKISICTNGTLYFTDGVQDFLRKWHMPLSLGISIDGNKELHDSCRVHPDGSGSYDNAMKACHHYEIMYGQLPGSKMTIAHENIPFIVDGVISMMDEGYDLINLNCVYEDAWAEDDATKLYFQFKGLADYLIERDRCLTYWLSFFKYEEFKPQNMETDTQNYCGGTGAMIAVDYKGDIFPCIRFMKSSLGDEIEPLCIGNLKVGIAGTKAFDDKYNELLSITRQSQSETKCLTCPVSQGCGWCTGYNYQTFGTANKRATFICKMHLARALINGYMWNKFFIKHDMPYVFHNYIPKEWALEIIPEEEYNMIIGLEQDIIFSERNDGREIDLTNYGTFHDDDSLYTEDELKMVPNYKEPWMDYAPEGWVPEDQR